jgi:hypothetical protein
VLLNIGLSLSLLFGDTDKLLLNVLSQKILSGEALAIWTDLIEFSTEHNCFIKFSKEFDKLIPLDINKNKRTHRFFYKIKNIGGEYDIDY